MHIVVCIKQVLDPEIPRRTFRVNRTELRADVPDAALVMSVFDANALETGLRLRDAVGRGSTVTALSLGSPRAGDVLRKALEVTADAAVLLSDVALEHLDSPGVATVIAAAVRRLATEGRPADLILTGRQAGDWEHGQTGGMIAEALGWPCVTFASRLRPIGGGLEMRREVEDGHEIVRARPPLVVTITNDRSNRLRLPRVRDVIRAQRATMPTWGIAELQLHPAQLAHRTTVVDLVVRDREGHCELIEGQSPADQAAALARRLRELSLV